MAKKNGNGKGKSKGEAPARPKKEKIFTQMVIKEIMFQKNMNESEALAYLNKNHR